LPWVGDSTAAGAAAGGGGRRPRWRPVVVRACAVGEGSGRRRRDAAPAVWHPWGSCWRGCSVALGGWQHSSWCRSWRGWQVAGAAPAARVPGLGPDGSPARLRHVIAVIVDTLALMMRRDVNGRQHAHARHTCDCTGPGGPSPTAPRRRAQALMLSVNSRFSVSRGLQRLQGGSQVVRLRLRVVGPRRLTTGTQQRPRRKQSAAAGTLQARNHLRQGCCAGCARWGGGPAWEVRLLTTGPRVGALAVKERVNESPVVMRVRECVCAAALNAFP